MVHTATLICSPITREQYKAFTEAAGSQWIPEDNRYINMLHKSKGVVVIGYYIDKGFKSYVLVCRVNFKRLYEQQQRIEVYQSSEYLLMLQSFNDVLSEMNLPEAIYWKVNRIDYCINVHTKYAARYIQLMQKGDIPYTQRLQYDKISRNYNHKKGSVYLPSKSRDKRKGTTGSITINFYDKYDQLRKESKTNPDITEEILEQAKDVLRLEVQCHKSKLDTWKACKRIPDKSITSLLQDESLSYDIIERAILQICKKGTYYRKSKAIKLVNDSHYTEQTKQQLIEIMQAITDRSSIARVRQKYIESGMKKEQFNEYIRKLDKIDVNPVMLSENKEMQLPNVYDLFDAAINQQLYIDDIEIEYINDWLSDVKEEE